MQGVPDIWQTYQKFDFEIHNFEDLVIHHPLARACDPRAIDDNSQDFGWFRSPNQKNARFKLENSPWILFLGWNNTVLTNRKGMQSLTSVN